LLHWKMKSTFMQTSSIGHSLKRSLFIKNSVSSAY
jgi:hypothetical protein